MKMKDKPQSVAESEATLRVLEGKRAKLIARGAKLPEVRRGASYLAHVEGDATARKQLDKVNAEIATHASELASLDDAIHDARGRIAAAQAFEADVVKRVGARQAVEILAAFRQAGHDLDHALATVADRSAVLMQLLSQLHRATGSNFPSREQLDALGYAAVMTAVLRTPWGRSFRPLPPSQRREFARLLDGWAQVLEGRLRPLLIDEDAAA